MSFKRKFAKKQAEAATVEPTAEALGPGEAIQVATTERETLVHDAPRPERRPTPADRAPTHLDRGRVLRRRTNSKTGGRR